jgi:hypothetical protein
MIFHEQEYRSDQGQTIIQNVIDFGSPPEKFPIFLGVGYISIPSPMGPIEEKIKVPIAASSLVEAFANFTQIMERDGPAYAKKIVDAIKQKIAENQKKIITPSGNLPPFKGIVSS